MTYEHLILIVAALYSVGMLWTGWKLDKKLKPGDMASLRDVLRGTLVVLLWPIPIKTQWE